LGITWAGHSLAAQFSVASDMDTNRDEELEAVAKENDPIVNASNHKIMDSYGSTGHNSINVGCTSNQCSRDIRETEFGSSYSIVSLFQVSL